MKNLAFGIDLGTTNSCIAVLGVNRIPETIRLSNRNMTLQSCVEYLEDGRVVVGPEAYAHRYQDNVIYSVKRLMGSGKIIELNLGTKKISVRPAQVSAEILKELVRQVPKIYGNVTDVVITVPAYFNNLQVADTKEAASLAGLNLLGISREPTAASIAYAFMRQPKGNKTIMVCDLGGGTFDVSLVRLQKSGTARKYKVAESLYGESLGGTEEESGEFLISVLKNNGDMFLGGDDIDSALVKEVFKKEGIRLSIEKKENKEVYEKIVLSAEYFKKTGCPSASVPYDSKKYGEVQLQFDTEAYENSMRYTYDKVIDIVKKTLTDDDLRRLDSIVLVGGSTKSKIFKKFLKNDFVGLDIDDSLNPDESVALGAAVQANYLKYGDVKLNLTEILPISIGVSARGRLSKMIDGNTAVPCTKTAVFATEEDYQDSLKIDVYQGESLNLLQDVYLGSLVFDEIPKAKKEDVQVTVTLDVDLDGFLSCYANIKGFGEKKVKLQNLFASESVTKELSTDKRLLSWRALAEETGNMKFSALLDGYSAGNVDRKVIEDYVRGLVSFRNTVKSANKLKPLR
jgi:molecular chaperone DnaK